MIRTSLTLALVLVALAGLEAALGGDHGTVPGLTALLALVASGVLVGAAALLRALGLERPDRSDE
jgi:hypothetical protein